MLAIADYAGYADNVRFPLLGRGKRLARRNLRDILQIAVLRVNAGVRLE